MPEYQSGVHNFLVEVAKGNVAHNRLVRIRGYNPDIDAAATEDLWPEGGDANFLAAAQRLNIISDSANDTYNGTGARTIRIEGLNADYVEIGEDVTLLGATAVFTGQSFLRINTTHPLTAGTGGAVAGNIDIRDNAGAVILAGIESHSCSLNGFYTVPVGHTAYILDLVANTDQWNAHAVELRVREYGSSLWRAEAHIHFTGEGADSSSVPLSIEKQLTY